MPTLYANPFDISAPGFYFDDFDEWERKYDEAYEKRGTEEYSIDFIDGDEIETAVWYAGPGGNAGSAHLEDYFDLLDEDEDDQIRYLLYAQQYTPSKYTLEYASDLQFREGTIEDLVYDWIDQGIIEADNDSYFDYEAFGRDVRINGDMTNNLDPDDPDEAEEIAFYEGMSDQELGEYVVDSIGSVEDAVGKDRIAYYFDTAKFARDLEIDGYYEAVIDGTTYTVEPLR